MEALGNKLIPYMLAFCVGFLLCNSTNAAEFDQTQSYYGVKVEMTLGGPEHGKVKWRPFKDNIQFEGVFEGKEPRKPVEGSESAKFNTDKAVKALLERMGVDL